MHRSRLLRTIPARFRLGSLLIAIAALALLLSVVMPSIRRAIGPNTWIVGTVHRPDGTVVRRRIRRHPDRDQIFEEVISRAQATPSPSPSRSGP